MVTRVILPINKILIDTDALVALASSSDSGHDWAQNVRKKIWGWKCVIYLSSFSFGEVVTVSSQKLGLKVAWELAEKMNTGGYVIVEVDKELRSRGLEWFKKQTTKNARFTDCVNMALMEEVDIKWVFSRDELYRKNGFMRLGLDE